MDKPMINVENPVDGSLIGQIPDEGASGAHAAIAVAADAFDRWSVAAPARRSKVLKNWHGAILAHGAELAQIIEKETGKPAAQAKAEVQYAASFVAWFAEQALQVAGREIVAPAKDISLKTYRKPVGVCYAATPWNFPAAMVTRKVAPAIAAGCTVVLKPSELTPFTAIKLASLLEEPGILSVVTGLPGPITDAVMESDIVRKVSFTGSTPVGVHLMEQSAKTLKRLSLELGGNAPFIVMVDADVEEAVKGLVYAKFRNTGQNCISPNRILVQQQVLETFLAKLKHAVGSLIEGVDYGPLINAKAVDKVERLVDEAVKAGAVPVLNGGRRAGLGHWFSPVILTGIKPEMAISREEIFGPVVAIHAFSGPEEAVKLANDTPFGLAAYIYTKSPEMAGLAPNLIHTGMIGVNTTRISMAEAPFGGVKHSGFGREGGVEAIEEYLETRLVCTAS